MSKYELVQYADEYGLYVDWWLMADAEDGADLTVAFIINGENEQRLRSAIIPAEDEHYEEARKELTLTSRYHDWHNTIADRILAQAEDEDTEDYLDGIEEYNASVSAVNKYDDRAYLTEGTSRDEVIETIENNF